MQIIHLGNRPDLKSRRIPSHPRKIAIVQPVPHSLLARDARKRQILVGPRGGGVARLRAELVVLLDEAGADEEDVANADVAALGFGAQIEALGGGAGLQLGEGDCVRGVGVVGLVVGECVVAVVEEDCSTGDAVACPVVDAAARAWGVTEEIRALGLGMILTEGQNVIRGLHTPL